MHDVGRYKKVSCYGNVQTKSTMIRGADLYLSQRMMRHDILHNSRITSDIRLTNSSNSIHDCTCQYQTNP